MIKETGRLNVGIEADGKTHLDFELRPRLVRDSVAVVGDERARENPAYEGLAMTCMQIVKLGDLPKERITPDLLMDLHDVDMSVILEAAERLRARLATFRAGSEKPAAATVSADENRVPASRRAGA